MDDAALARIGSRLRRVPGLAPALDARARLAAAMRRRRVERRIASRDAERLRALGARGDVLLNVGCGPGPVEGWVNADLAARGQEVLHMDAAAPWPLPDGCAVAVNSEHFIEHLSLAQAGAYLREAHRVLAPGGVIRTSTPDLRGMAEAYLEADPASLEAHRGHGYEAGTHGDLVNNYFYVDGHRHIYDFPSLAGLLEQAGFERIEPARFGESRHQLLQGIDTHDTGALRGLVLAVDAVKPG